MIEAGRRLARWVTADAAIGTLDADITVVFGMVEPAALTDELAAQSARLAGQRVVVWPLFGAGAYAAGEARTRFRIVSMHHNPSGEDVAYIPTRVSDAHEVLRKAQLGRIAVMLHVSPPDAAGWCTFGTMADYTFDLACWADLVIAQVNAALPSPPGIARIHVDAIDYLVSAKRPIPTHTPAPPNAVEAQTARNVAEVIADGATLQIGIGRIPDAVLGALATRSDLGLHSGTIGDGVMELHAQGVFTGRDKPLLPGLLVAGCALGTRRLYDWMHHNAALRLMPFSWTHDPRQLLQFDSFVSVNSALEVDLSGQVNTEVVGGRLVGNVGGQPDFQFVAARAPRGHGIVALPSRTRHGQSRIVAALAAGSGVASTRADADMVVTEYGVAELRGRTLAERAAALIAIAHPDERDGLRAQALRRV